MPVSRGNTPEKVEGAAAPKPQPADPAPVAASAGQLHAAAHVVDQSFGGVADRAAAPARRAAPLGDSLRNLQQLPPGPELQQPEGRPDRAGPGHPVRLEGRRVRSVAPRFIAQVKSNWFVPRPPMRHDGPRRDPVQRPSRRHDHRPAHRAAVRRRRRSTPRRSTRSGSRTRRCRCRRSIRTRQAFVHRHVPLQRRHRGPT